MLSQREWKLSGGLEELGRAKCDLIGENVSLAFQKLMLAPTPSLWFRI